MKVTSTDIKIALAKIHTNDYFITECKNGSTYFPPAQGLLKFDGLAIKKSYTQPCITGYEIKVSRGDFLQDNKWHLYLQYCHEFYFVCPNGLIKKEELPDNVGLIYYYPEKGTLRKKKKALYRKIEPPVGLYEYIIYSRLEKDRIPFYDSKVEFAKAYIANQELNSRIGRELGTAMAKKLEEMENRLYMVQGKEEVIQKYQEISSILAEHKIYTWQTDFFDALKKALNSSYPVELETVKRRLNVVIEELDEIESKYGGGQDEK